VDLPEALVAELAESRRRLAHLTGDLDDIFDFQQGSPPDDEHDIEGSSVGFERARVTALLRSERAHLEALEQAVAKVRAGSYGTCERCGHDIATDRLDALPAVTTCVTCVGAV
jgi:DnaK suppressor protein